MLKQNEVRPQKRYKTHVLLLLICLNRQNKCYNIFRFNRVHVRFKSKFKWWIWYKKPVSFGNNFRLPLTVCKLCKLETESLWVHASSFILSWLSYIPSCMSLFKTKGTSVPHHGTTLAKKTKETSCGGQDMSVLAVSFLLGTTMDFTRDRRLRT